MVDAQISKMRRLITGHRRTTIRRSRTSCSASASSTPRSSASTSTRRARSIRRSSSCRPTSAAPLQAQQKSYETAGAEVAARGGQGATSAPPSSGSTSAWTRCSSTSPSCSPRVKKEDQAREFFHRLIKDYPNSKYIPDAYLSFAEYYFDKGEMENALKFYEKVEQFPKSSVYPYAVYKKGWCYVNLGDYKTALETFVGVVRMTQEGKVNVPKTQIEALAKEAKKDIVKAYAHVGGPDKAWEFFQRTGGDFAPKMMEALAELYWEAGQVRRLEPRLQEGHRAEHGLAAHLRVAEQDRPQHAVGRQQERPGPGDRAPRRRLRQGRRDEGRSRRTSWRSAATPSTTRRRSWRSSGTRKRRRRRTRTPTRSTSSSTRCSSTTSRRTRTPTR